jgi:5-(hydroxymethyl)furfural/furfural oxidase
VVGAVVKPLAGGPEKTLSAGEVIVSTGALHTPALLMRSGIGPGAELQKHGIAIVAARAGVGANLMEHPSTAVSTYLPPHARLADLGEHHDHAILRYSSGIGGAPEGDMHIAMIARSGWHPVGQRIGTLFIWVNKAFSRGSVTLKSADPFEEPLVDFRLLSDWRDLERLKDGFRVAAKGLSDPKMNAVREIVFPTTYSPRVARIAGPGAWNALQRNLFAGMLDLAGPLRPALIHNVVTLGIKLDTLLKDDNALTEFVTGGVGGVWHASGTARMGRPDDPLAVADSTGRVYGVDGLRVVDASLMPSIPRANTNTPTIMMAERIADLIKQQRRTA